jgi:hypothetical protein
VREALSARDFDEIQIERETMSLLLPEVVTLVIGEKLSALLSSIAS